MDLWQAISIRRDTRHFTQEAVPDTVLIRALEAAHRGPSVGLSEPGRYVVIRSQTKRLAIHQEFLRQRQLAEEELHDAERLDLHQSLKLEAIVDAPVGIAVFCDSEPQGPAYILGAKAIPETLSWSVACSIQNLWLTLTEAGYGMGWVSFLDPKVLAAIVEAPDHWQGMGYLCIGRPATDYQGEPMLQKAAWGHRSSGPQVFQETVSCDGQ